MNASGVSTRHRNPHTRVGKQLWGTYPCASLAAALFCHHLGSLTGLLLDAQVPAWRAFFSGVTDLSAWCPVIKEKVRCMA